MQIFYCISAEAKSASRKCIYLSATLRHDIEEACFQLVLYRRLAIYHKFLIDRCENICDYFAGRNRASTLALNIFMENSRRQGSLFANHSCPSRANEMLGIISPRVSSRLFEFPLLPSGYYCGTYNLSIESRT